MIYRQSIEPNEKTKPRILCIGESTTYGEGLPIEETYPFMLNKFFPGAEIYNLGRCGQYLTECFINFFHSANTHKRYFRLDDKGYFKKLKHYIRHSEEYGWKDLEPDIVVIAMEWNDLVNLLIREVMKCGFPNTNIRAILMIWQNWVAKRMMKNDNLWDYILNVRKTYKKDMGLFISMWKVFFPNVKIHLVSLPYCSQYFSDFSKTHLEWMKMMNKPVCDTNKEVLRELGKEMGVKVVNIDVPDSRIYYQDPYHFTKKGNEIIANVLKYNLHDDYSRIIEEDRCPIITA